MASRGSRSNIAISITGLVLGLILMVSVNIVSTQSLTDWRFDLTEDSLYTLSGSTRAILAKLDEPVTLRYYYSKRLGDEIPIYGAYADRVRELLEQYTKAAKGKLNLEYYDPEPFSEVEDRAVGFGLQGVPIDQSGEQVYFGLAGTNSVDDEETIPFFQAERERFLEYDLTRLVFELANPKKPVIGLITSLSLTGDYRPPFTNEPRPWVVYDQLQQFFDMRDLGSEVKTIGDDVDVLMVAHPMELDEQTLYAIDQFVLKGGRAMLFTDPHSEAMSLRTSPDAGPTMTTSSQLDKLYEAWGLEISKNQIAGDLRSAWRVRSDPKDPLQAVDYVVWMRLSGDALNGDDVVTGELTALNFATSGFIRSGDGAPVEIRPLVSTSPDSMEIDVMKVRMDPRPRDLLANFVASGEPMVLAARVTGTVPSAFPDGPPTAKEDEKEKPPMQAKDEGEAEEPQVHLTESQAPISVIVVADADVLADRYWVQVQDFFGQKLVIPTADNANFVINAIDNLSGSEELIALRSRGVSARPFGTVLKIRQDAEFRYRATERELQDKLQEAQTKLAELERVQQAEGGAAILTPQQRQEIDKFRSQVLRFRTDLREVQRALREDIEGLGRWLKFINIGFIPVVIGLLAIVIGVVRARRRARRYRIV